MSGTVEALAAEAMGSWGGQSLALIRNRENAVFRMALPAGKVAALRMHREGYQHEGAIRSELWWCTELAARGLPVPRPLPAQGGAALVRLSSGRFASAVEWLPGEPLGDGRVPFSVPTSLQVDRHHALGRLLAQIHAATETMVPPADFERPSWDVDGLTGTTPFWGRFWDHPALNPAEAARFRVLRDDMRQRFLAALSGVAPVLIHADALRENVLVAGREVSLIDFDDCGWGYRPYDLGVALSQNLREPAFPALREALIAGYATVRPVDPALVDLFTLARCCASVGWTMPRLGPGDPAHRAHIDRALSCAERVLA